PPLGRQAGGARAARRARRSLGGRGPVPRGGSPRGRRARAPAGGARRPARGRPSGGRVPLPARAVRGRDGSTARPAPRYRHAADLGHPVTPAEARVLLGAPFLLPDTAGRPLLRAQAGIVSTLLATPEPVLLMETRFTGLMKKLALSSAKLESVAIGPGVEGV